MLTTLAAVRTEHAGPRLEVVEGDKVRAIFKNKGFIDKVDEIWDLVRIEAIKAQGGRVS